MTFNKAIYGIGAAGLAFTAGLSFWDLREELQGYGVTEDYLTTQRLPLTSPLYPECEAVLSETGDSFHIAEECRAKLSVGLNAYYLGTEVPKAKYNINRVQNSLFGFDWLAEV